jgi:SAM-dependent methyltransferase
VAKPWWIEHAANLAAESHSLATLTLGQLWNLSERVRFVRENVEAPLLRVDFEQHADARETWARFEQVEEAVARALRHATDVEAELIRNGARPPRQFHQHWLKLGFPAADDYLDGLFQLTRLSLEEELPPLGLPNMSSRAERIADFLDAMQPGSNDVVYDLGCGSGKVALTVAASSEARVRGVEIGASYVTAANSSAERLGLRRIDFADVRNVDFSDGTQFYLFYPFRDAAASAVSKSLATLARSKRISLYVAGPQNGFREFFEAQVARGAFRLLGRRGEFQEVMLLTSANS